MAPLTFRLMACVFSCSEMSLLPDAESSLVKQLQERWIVEMFHMFVFFSSPKIGKEKQNVWTISYSTPRLLLLITLARVK